ncbi:MAG: glycerophosphodiester phosphodiesterase family protein [Balneolaceae bacterium]
MKQIFFLLSLLLHSSLLMAQTNSLPDIPTNNEDGFIVIAHRGASFYAPENTHSAFKLAIEMKAEMIELDVSLSKDGVPVVVHDETVDRTTNGKGLVSNYTLRELKNLETGSWFSDKYSGEPFPTLSEVLAYTKDKISVNIEIKTEAVTDELKDGIIEKALQIVEKAGVGDQVIFSSFDYRVMEHLEKLAPEMSKAILYEKSQSGDMKPSELVTKYKVNAFNCSHRQLSDEWIEDLKTNNIPFFIYTVNDEKLMKTIIEKGASGIFSDKPDLLKKVVENL